VFRQAEYEKPVLLAGTRLGRFSNGPFFINRHFDRFEVERWIGCIRTRRATPKRNVFGGASEPLRREFGSASWIPRAASFSGMDEATKSFNPVNGEDS